MQIEYGGQSPDSLIWINIHVWNADHPENLIGVFEYEYGLLLAPLKSDDKLNIPFPSAYADFVLDN